MALELPYTFAYLIINIRVFGFLRPWPPYYESSILPFRDLLKQGPASEISCKGPSFSLVVTRKVTQSEVRISERDNKSKVSFGENKLQEKVLSKTYWP